MLGPLALLGPSIVAVWIPSYRTPAWRRLPMWVPLFALAVAVALSTGVLQWPGALALAVLAGLCWASRNVEDWRLRGIATLAVLLLALVLSLHLVPGFRNPIAIDAVRFAADSIPFTQYANFDKGAVGLLLLAFLVPRVTSLDDARRIALPTACMAVATIVIVLGIASAAGVVRWDPKWPPEASTFLAINLLLTCVAEEAFFRGVLQEKLAQSLARFPRLAWVPVVASTLLFAVAHVRGGWPLVALAGLAGLGSSIVYAWTRRIESAVLVHFALNAVHFVGFSYPALAR